MPITPHALTSDTAKVEQYYSIALYQTLLMFEESGEVKTQAYTDDKGIPTIGVGINMRAHMGTILLKAFGIEDNGLVTTLNKIVNKQWAANLKGDTAKTLRDELNTAMADYKKTHPTVTASDFVLSTSQVKDVFDALVPKFNKNVLTFLADKGVTNLENSREFLALMSLAWANPGELLGPGLGQALKDGNRADAWFQIRYGSNKGWDTKAPTSGTGGVAARRDVEAHLFGLYDGATATEAEARNAYAMLSKSRATILAYEAKLGVSPDTPDNSGSYLKTGQDKFDALKTNINTALSSASLAGLGDAFPAATVQTLIQSLTPAYAAFITYANTLHGAGAPDIDQSVISNAAAIYFQGDPFSQTLDARVDESGSGNKLNNNLIVGGAGLDTEYGGTGNDYLMGLGGVDTLDGGEGDDTLIGGTGNDALNGGAGEDTYVFASGNGKDTVVDADGKGSVMVAGAKLTGAISSNYQVVGSLGQWSINGGEIVYTLDETTKILLITGTSLGTGSLVTINDFDASKAEGYLGIKLERPVKTAFGGAGSANPFNTDILPTNLTATVLEGGGASCRLFLAAPAKSGDTLILNASGTGVSLCGVVLGDDTVPLSGGVTLTLLEGQTEIAFAIVNTADLSANTNLTLSASYTSDGQTVTSSNSETITLVDAGAPSHTFIGDQRGKLIGTETQTDIGPSDPRYGTFVWAATSWAADGTLTGGKPEADFNDVITATAENDRIDGKGGNDALDGKAGNDQIDGGAGDDTTCCRKVKRSAIVATTLIACYAISARSRGRFGIKTH